MRSANSKTVGFSLIEFLVAAGLGGVSLVLIGSVFISAQRVAHEKSQQLYLLQSLTSTFQIVEEDIQRAGYDGGLGAVLKLSAAADVIQVSGASEFGMAYYRDEVGLTDFRNVRYRLIDNKLQVCEQSSTSKNTLLTLNSVGNCRSLLDDGVVDVTSFAISSTPLSSSSTHSSLWHLFIIAVTKDGLHSQTLKVDIKQRNWQ
ncbi:PulJ/GspJ family protein [Vibrio sp. LaRot3]|uniref:PulJ/GspJ family protein n=1 Tax=Vibrio sp. LaRot3 TaxID=2998829 RepID=UPI0022CE1CC1|nr:hypothetical protein [Vibrio sp. LaRot3]MDA0149236.1 hypothetical protein [Vibrio sp. LaRot3]